MKMKTHYVEGNSGMFIWKLFLSHPVYTFELIPSMRFPNRVLDYINSSGVLVHILSIRDI